jgi:hypothetical protein
MILIHVDVSSVGEKFGQSAPIPALIDPGAELSLRHKIVCPLQLQVLSIA